MGLIFQLRPECDKAPCSSQLSAADQAGCQVGLEKPKRFDYASLVPTVLRNGGFSVRIYTRDHPPPHVHCWKGDAELVVELDPIAIRENHGISRSDARRALAIVAAHQAFFNSRMAKDSPVTLPLTEAEFERQFAAASRRGAERRHNQPLATSVRYDPNRGVMIELNNDCLVCVPLRLLPDLAHAAPKDLRRVKILGVGQAIEWRALDEQFDVLQLVADAVGANALMAKLGQRGGRVKSKAKAAAARANGRKGGRPGKRRPEPA